MWIDLYQNLCEARRQAHEVSCTRTSALPNVLGAIRALEAALVAALDDEPLRGLRNLGGRAKFLAARVRGRSDKKFPSPGNAKGDRDYLVIVPSGRLRIAWWHEVSADEVELRDRPARDADFMPSDVDALIRTLDEIVPRHVDTCKRVQARWAKTAQLADQVTAVLSA